MTEKLTEKLAILLQGDIPEKINTAMITGEDNLNLANMLNQLILFMREIHDFIIPLSKGELTEIKISRKNFLASPFKELHSRLIHLTWQANQVANGDFNQRVDFMGDFSEAFNNMIVSLDNKDKTLKKKIGELEKALSHIKKTEKALRKSEKKFRELSIIDNLTLLYNSRHFYNQLKMEIDRANRYTDPMTIILLDVDNFKAFNDTYGHIEGDQVLVRLGQVIKRCLRKIDSAYRYGGEEFVIILPVTACEDGVIIAERIRAEFKKENFSTLPGTDAHMTLSLGVSQYIPMEEMKGFVRRADQLMYQAKKNGKDRTCFELND